MFCFQLVKVRPHQLQRGRGWQQAGFSCKRSEKLCEIFLMNMWNIPSGLSSCGPERFLLCSRQASRLKRFGETERWLTYIREFIGVRFKPTRAGLKHQRGRGKKWAFLQPCNGRVATMESVTARSAALVKWDAALAIHTVIIPPHVFGLLYRWNGGMKAGINKKWFSFKLARINYSAPLCW